MSDHSLNVSRRAVVRALGATGLASALPWAEALAKKATEHLQAATPQDLLDSKVKVINTYHEQHCHGSCMLKAYVKDGRLLALTSAGDIPLKGSRQADESIFKMQRRCCPRGLAERKRLYAPDRLKYPLLQTIERGNLAGFKRITWDEALDRACEEIERTVARQKELGYIPAWSMGDTLLPYLGHYVDTYGNQSTGNQIDCLNNCFGREIRGNPAIDMLNSKFIVLWSANTQATSPQWSLYLTKAREKGIPIVAVDPRYSNTVGAMATGAPGITPWIGPRPGTDGVILAAMCNTIYRRKLYDEAYLRKYTFGFYPNETIISQSPLNDPLTGKPYKGQRFTVPKGQSFIEYLDRLQVEHGGETGVLKWAEEISGVSAQTIENLAVTYAKAKPACLFSGAASGGAQRSSNGMYFVWLQLALAAMTGNATVRGGGIGFVGRPDGYTMTLGAAPKLTEAKKFSPLRFMLFNQSQILTTGRDLRTPEQMRDDIKRLNGIDLGTDPRIRVEMVWRGGGSGDRFNQSSSINPKIEAWKRLRFVLCYERFMSSTARFSDLVLPSCTQFEQSYFHAGRMKTDMNAVRQIVDPMYECKPDYRINEMIAERLGLDWGRHGMSDMEIMRKQWAGAKLPEAYKKIDPECKLPSFEEMLEEANLQLPVPPEESVLQINDYQAGQFPTDTGRINFYSPYIDQRGRAEEGAYCHYVPAEEGYESIKAGKKSVGGRLYTLQLTSPHVIERSHTQFDNITMLADCYRRGIMIHPDDAQKRGIKDGDKIYLYNDYGCTKMPAIVTKRQCPGSVAVGQGSWYQPSKTEFYNAVFDGDYDGKPEVHKVPVDVGGCLNVLTRDKVYGSPDPIAHVLSPSGGSGGMAVNGRACEVSKTLPVF